MKVQCKLVLVKEDVKKNTALSEYLNARFPGWSWGPDLIQCLSFWFSTEEYRKLCSCLEKDVDTIYISYSRLWYDTEEVLPKIDFILNTSNFVDTMSTNRKTVNEALYDYSLKQWHNFTESKEIVKWWSPQILSNLSEL